MKLCAIILSCLLGFVFQTATAQTTPPQKRIVGKPRAKINPRQQPAPAKPLQDEMDDAAAQSAPQPPARRYMAPLPVETTHELGDLVYLTPESKFQLDVDYDFSTFNIEQRSNGFLLGNAKNSYQELQATAQYGLFHHFAFGLSWSYQLTGNLDSTLPSGTSSRTQQIGYEDPILIGAYQLLDQDDGTMNLIFKFGYSPKMGNAKDGTTTSNGNALRGSDMFLLNAEMSRKFSAFELAGQVAVNSFGSSTSESAAGSSFQGSSDGNTAFGAVLGARTGFSFIHLAAAIQFASTSSYSSISSSTGSKTSYPQNSTFTYLGALDFDIVKDVCLLEVDYKMTPSYTFDATLSNSTTNVKVDRNTLGFKLSFLF